MLGFTAMSTTPAKAAPLEPTPYAPTVDMLLRLRWAEALLAAREAEDVIAHYASLEAQTASKLDKEDR